MEKAEFFKQKFLEIVRVFFGLQNEYLHDDPTVTGKIELFRKYLPEFNKRYRTFGVILEESDLTTDDLKLLIKGFKDKSELLKKLGMEDVHFIIKRSSKYKCLQALIDYNDLKEENCRTLSILTAIAVMGDLCCDISEMPEEIRYASSFEIDPQAGSGNAVRG